MTDTEALKRLQSRRFMLRFDLPVQDIAMYDEASLHDMFHAACCPTGKDGRPRWKAWGQIEKGEKNGRWHMQAYCESPSDAPLRASTIINAVRKVTDTDGRHVSSHISPAVKKPDRCVGYVTKERTRVYGPWSNVPEDQWPRTEDDGEGARTERDDLYAAVMVDGLGVREVLSNPDLAVAASSCMNWLEKLERERQRELWGVGAPRRPMEVVYLYGDANTGKSTVARDYLADVVGDRGYFSVCDYRRDPWDGYAGEAGLLLDDLRLPTEHIGLSEILRMFDGTPYQLGRRYANSWAAFSRVVVTSNWSLRRQWESLQASAPLSAQLTDEDRRAFYRRFSRVLHVMADGSISDETAVYREDIDCNGRTSLDALKAMLAGPEGTPEPIATPPTLPGLDGVNIVRWGRAESVQDAIDFFGL